MSVVNDLAPTEAPSTAEAGDAYKLHRRWDRLARLVSDDGMQRLQNSFVAVIGLGGVGSFAAESIVRSGVGRVRVVDFDESCVTNSNRQLHALKGNIGKPKSALLGERFQLINPQAVIEPVKAFYNEETADALLDGSPDYVVDAIDNVTAKCHLIATCKARGIPLVTCLGAAGRWDPTQIRIADLNRTRNCRLGVAVRDILRQKHGFPKSGLWGVTAVFSEEFVQAPHPLAYDGEDGFKCVCPQGQNGLFECDRRNRIDGSASFVTGAFGLYAASVIVKALAQGAPKDA
jgi:tRNA A37 threonylcarbamoyladenosine dehydratase